MPPADAPRCALICGVSGQDGTLLARHLLGLGYRVVGTSRDAAVSAFAGLRALGIAGRVETVSMTLTDFRSVLSILRRVQPDEVYNLAGQTSVGLSFELPVETTESITLGTLNLLEAVRFLGAPIRLYNAASSECFGDTDGVPADEMTAFRPRSPYAVAKAAAFWQVANYREAYGLFACSGILFNHESPLRPERFVTRKIVATACRIAAGSAERSGAGQPGGGARLGVGGGVCGGDAPDAAAGSGGRLRDRDGTELPAARVRGGGVCGGGTGVGGAHGRERGVAAPHRPALEPGQRVEGGEGAGLAGDGGHARRRRAHG